MSKKKILSCLKKILLHPIPSSIIATLAIVSGGIVSLYSHEIRSSFPLSFSISPSFYTRNISLAACGFWISLISFILLSFSRNFFKDQELNEYRDKLINTIITLPPDEFALKYDDEYENVRSLSDTIINTRNYYSSKKENLNSDDLKMCVKMIRTILGSYLDLAFIWDKPESLFEKDTIYRSNIMIFYEVNNLSKSIKENLLTYKNFFVDKNTAEILSSIDALLLLEDMSMTATTLNEKPECDPNIKPLILPVTYNNRSGKRYQNLPGAPKAIEENRMQWITDTSNISKICDKNKDFDGTTKKKIKEYYKKEKKATSIISMPLRHTLKHKQNQDQFIGVVNIYRNKTSILKSERRAYQFNAFLSPFNYLLSEALIALMDIKDWESKNING